MRNFISITMLALFLASCNDDVASASATVEGKWELVRALRNNTETGMLDGLQIEFQPDGNLITNLMGNEDPGTYVWEGNQIKTEGIKLPLVYDIQEMSDTSMHLRSNYRGFQFDFMLARANEAESQPGIQ